MNEQETISYDHWEIQRYGKGTPYPFLIFDNWYLPHEEKAVWSEIEFYMRNPLIQRPIIGNPSLGILSISIFPKAPTNNILEFL